MPFTYMRVGRILLPAGVVVVIEIMKLNFRMTRIMLGKKMNKCVNKTVNILL